MSAITSPFHRPRAGMVERIAGWSIRHRWLAIVLWVALVAGSVLAANAAGTRHLSSADTGAGQSGRAERALQGAAFPVTMVEQVLLRDPAGGTLNPERVRSVVSQLRTRMRAVPEAASVGAPVRSGDGRAVLVPVTLDTDGATGDRADELAVERVKAVSAAVAAIADVNPDVRIGQVGDASVQRAMDATVSDDFQRAEFLSLPLTLVIMILAFGALIAAGVPVLLALSAVVTALGLSALSSHIFPIEESVNSVILLIGMAVGVDYSLFYIRRAREERGRGRSDRRALELAAATSGRAVVVSGLAVMVSMSGLMLSGQAVFRSMAVGTMLVVAVAVAGSLTVLPALLSVLGHRVDRPRVPLLHRLSQPGRTGRFWPATMRAVLARPRTSLLVVGGALVLMAVPASRMHLGETGVDALPGGIPEIATYRAMTEAFPQKGFAHTVVVWSRDGAPLNRAALDEGVRRVVAAARDDGTFTLPSSPAVTVAPDGRTATLELPYAGDLNGDQARRSLAVLRHDLLPELTRGQHDADAAVTGAAAESVDFTGLLSDRLPLVMGFVLSVTFLVLVVAFRSVVLAATAVLLNLLSVGAAYGLVVTVFQHGVGAGLVGASSTGFVVDWLPLFLFVVLFGLSMDYHVFVVSRIREAHEAGMPTLLAISRGVSSSAGVVTSAAAVMVGVFSIFGFLSLLEFKQLGVGLAAAILIDATLVRAVLLPATMAVLGRWNWWTPARLRRVPRALPEGAEA